jgi:tight adherence protein B
MSVLTVLAALLVLGGLGLAGYALSRRDQRRVHDLREILELSYLDDGTELDPKDASSLLARSGALAERALEGTDLLTKLRTTVQRSDWTVKPGELVAISLALAVIGAIVGFLATPVLGAILAVIGLVGPFALVSRSVNTRTRRFEAQFPDILDLIAASLESGASVQQALELVVAEADEPAASEFGRVLAATRLGSPLVDALEEMSARLESRDLAWTVQAIIVQQRTGGRLAEVLRIVADVMRGREEVRREISALTAEGRLSAYILSALPVIFAMFLAVVRPDYLHPLISTAVGILMLGVSGVLLVVAYVAMIRIVKIEV